MDQHIKDWLAAYHDGELTGSRLTQVETHLEHCSDCRSALHEIQMVSVLLQINPPASVHTNPERFIAQVNLRLPRKQLQPAWKRTLQIGWRLAPFGLLGVWVFFQAVLLVSGLVTIALKIGIGVEQLTAVFPLAEPAAGFFESLPLTGASLGEIITGIGHIFSTGGPFGWGLPLYLILTVVLGLMYWGWLASWRIRRKQMQT